MTIWTTPKEHNGFVDRIAWWPVHAKDEYSGRFAWVWLRGIRQFDDGRITFSSFWI
jgi:hypothetical protein